ncbi:MAG: hypothetical protein KGO02_11470 [Alphaproteobacteria bacterium]|nr:hypothetical protein [Alphaproteobacteria bacterium]
MGKKIIRFVWSALVWVATTFTPTAFLMGVLVAVVTAVITFWEQLTISERIALAMVSLGGTLAIFRYTLLLADWLVYRFRRSFKITALEPEEVEIPGSKVGLAHSYRLAVACTDKGAEIKTLKCRIGEIVPYDELEPSEARRLNTLRFDLRKSNSSSFGQQPQTHHLAPGESIEFDFFFTQPRHWSVCVTNLEASHSIPLGGYAIRVDVFGEESRAAQKWFIAKPDAFGHGELLVEETPRGFSPQRPEKRPTKPQILGKAERTVLKALEQLQTLLEQVPTNPPAAVAEEPSQPPASPELPPSVEIGKSDDIQ